MTHRNTVSRHFIMLAAITLLVVVAGISMALAQQLVQPDGRLNQVAHFGGDALYCVDDNNQTTNRLPAMMDGGFRLLSGNGQELWFVPGADVDAALAEVKESGESQLVASGQGSYGAAYLYTYYEGNNATFVFTGYDEHGKPNSLTFTGCTPVGPGQEALCTIDYQLNVPIEATLLSNGDDNGEEIAGDVIPCNLCASEGGTLSGDVCYMDPVFPGPNGNGNGDGDGDGDNGIID